jgi:hypothetical protein
LFFCRRRLEWRPISRKGFFLSMSSFSFDGMPTRPLNAALNADPCPGAYGSRPPSSAAPVDSALRHSAAPFAATTAGGPMRRKPVGTGAGLSDPYVRTPPMSFSNASPRPPSAPPPMGPTAEGAGWEPSYPAPAHLGYGGPRGNPVREQLERNLRAEAKVPTFVYVQTDGNGNFAIDGDAMNLQAMMRGQAAGRDIAAMNILGNDNGDHQKHSFRVFEDNIPRILPPAMQRRGVPETMFDEDMQRLRGIARGGTSSADADTTRLLLTCGMWAFVMCMRDCAGTDPMVAFRRELDAHVNDMNGRYRPYGVTWDVNFIPYSGTYCSYET